MRSSLFTDFWSEHRFLWNPILGLADIDTARNWCQIPHFQTHTHTHTPFYSNISQFSFKIISTVHEIPHPTIMSSLFCLYHDTPFLLVVVVGWNKTSKLLSPFYVPIIIIYHPTIFHVQNFWGESNSRVCLPIWSVSPPHPNETRRDVTRFTAEGIAAPRAALPRPSSARCYRPCWSQGWTFGFMVT